MLRLSFTKTRRRPAESCRFVDTEYPIVPFTRERGTDQFLTLWTTGRRY